MFKTASLTPEQSSVIFDKATDLPFTGKLTDNEGPGTYLCRLCGKALFRATAKFHSGCGWPSFEQALPGAVHSLVDRDGMRSEIICATCHAHLGHVFQGEGFTPLNTRHCVNSTALDYVTDHEVFATEEIIVAAGCFWGVEYYLQQLPGVVLTEVGYCGGSLNHPSYAQVCAKTSGHFEVVRVVFDSAKLSLTDVLKRFFEIHDPEQTDGQGPDVGPQYLSAIFYYDEQQQQIASSIMQLLSDKGYQLATQLLPMAIFWPAEDYHQNYYNLKRDVPYCHSYTSRF